MRRPGRLVRPLLILLAAGVLAAQDQVHRPRLGLVLSGGGARGLAHIGVLQVLEAMRVPVDCVAGTSMGAIIGGLYSYGYSPAELERIVVNADWRYLLQDQPSRTDLSIRRKQEEYEFLVQLRVGVRDGKIALPKGLIQGQNLGLLLDQLTLEAHDLVSFDELPLPFRCVAADIGDGTRVVFERGDLPLAMRASMSLPGILAPVEADGRLLVDGGIIDNLPVEAARSLGAERLIAIDIGTPPLAREQIQDLLGITSQMVALLTDRYVQDAKKSLTAADVLIEPQLGDLTAADFERAPELIRLGREWASKHAAQLQRWSVPPDEFARWLARQRRAARPLPVIAEIKIETSPRITPAVVGKRLQTKAGDQLDLARLQADLERVYGMDLFEKVRFRLLRTVAGDYQLLVRADEKSWGPGYLRFSLDAGSDFSGADSFTMGVNYTLTSIGRTDAEWVVRADVGTDTDIGTEWFQPLSTDRFLFVAPAIGYRRSPFRTLIGGSQQEFVVDLAGGRFDAGAHFGGWGELRAGIDYGAGEVDSVSGLPLPDDDLIDAGLHASFLVDTLDSSMFPGAGVRAGATWKRRFESLGSDQEYETVRLDAFGAQTVWDQTFVLATSLQFQTSSQLQAASAFSIGGLFRVSGLGPISIGGPEGGLVTLLTYRALTPRGIYVGGSIEAGGVWSDWDTIDSDVVRIGGSVFAGLVTPIGPVYFAYGFAEQGEQSAYLVVGKIL
jgi:NTE family protein